MAMVIKEYVGHDPKKEEGNSKKNPKANTKKPSGKKTK